ncbi:MAG: glycosyltransferase family 4 protein [Cyclobacteriaceae bacterium]
MKNRLHIAWIVPGGIGTGALQEGVPVLQQTVTALAQEHDVKVYSLFPVSSTYKPAGFGLWSAPYRRWTSVLRLLWQVRNDHRSRPFDVVHGFWIRPGGLMAVVLQQWLHIPAVVTVQGGDAVYLPSIQYGQLSNSLFRQLAAWTLTKASAAVLLSGRQAETLAGFGIHCAHPVQIEWGVGSQFTKHVRDFRSTLRCLIVGNQVAVKDQATALRTFSQLRGQVDARLTLVGEGPLRKALHSLVSELGIADHVTWIDSVSSHAIADLYHSHDILLHTSLSEGQSLVVTEALHCGLLVAGTPVGPLVDIPESVVMADFGNPHALSQRILETINDTGKITSLYEQVAPWCEKTSLDVSLTRLIALYNSLH